MSKSSENHDLKVGERFTIKSGVLPPFDKFMYEITKIENGTISLKVVND